MGFISTQIVNGYPCHDCTDVDLAKKRIDPAHPKDGPDGAEAPEKKVEKAAQQLGGLPLAAGGNVGTRFNALA